MGTLWRSQPMQLIQLFVQIEAAHDTVDELGQLGLVEFRDQNPEVNAFQRNFVNEVKRCDEMERKLRFFEEQVRKEKGLTTILRGISVTDANASSSSGISIDELEGRCEDLEKELIQLNTNQQMLDRNYNELIELQHVLSADNHFFSENPGAARGEFAARSPLVPEAQQQAESSGSKSVKLGFLTGVIVRNKVPSFERVLWRATRGNLYMKQSDIDGQIKDPNTGDWLEKNVFIIFFSGERVQAKIKKICESFGATIYPCPENPNDRQKFLSEVTVRLQDLEVVLARSLEHRKQVLSGVAMYLQTWKAKVMKEKSIYHTMNLFNYDLGRKCLIAEGWCPQTATEDIQLALRRATQRSKALVPSILSIVPTDEVPPTYFHTNKYTKAFQEIVNAYGMAHYREVNPAAISLITFPFLFGVMFADVGHGIFLLMFSLFMILKEKQLMATKLNEIVQMPFGGRYVLFLMSLYAIYIGFIYNELFSVSMDIFGSSYFNPPEFNASCSDCVASGTFMNWTGKAYPFGVDPAWKGAPNELDYYNSFKMKLSILLGVTQMSIGIFFSLANYMHEKQPMKWINIVFQFIPQIVFLWSIFGYMCVLIIVKWCTDYRVANPGGPSVPYILPMIIQMFLSPSSAPYPFIGRYEINHDSSGNVLMTGPSQHKLQVFLVIIALLMVPLMLLPKPFLLKHFNDQRRHHKLVEVQQSDDEPAHPSGQHPSASSSSSGGGGGHGGHGEEFDFTEVFIHQIIHTIEFVLGAISNTASYLRLWALSLAHSELSTVFWNRIVIASLGGAWWQVFIAFSVWAGASFAVLLVMETLSAFLHALRLHWVEFQNKFYIGDGRRFLPYSYERVLSEDDAE
eukprot:TRINITY_DN992_c0_g2_i2.p1 TRINITY_DN992_c0_g2~~TRINITY_DN992_c0_g2_i2.p1  ORF type:complete len:855 (-),score=239.34 TRINITY_DN992_c0_g2_i2:45-2609(-)